MLAVTVRDGMVAISVGKVQVDVRVRVRVVMITASSDSIADMMTITGKFTVLVERDLARVGGGWA